MVKFSLPCPKCEYRIGITQLMSAAVGLRCRSCRTKLELPLEEMSQLRPLVLIGAFTPIVLITHIAMSVYQVLPSFKCVASFLACYMVMEFFSSLLLCSSEIKLAAK